MAQRQLPDRFRNVSDAGWFRLLAASVAQPVVDGFEFPRFPPAALQLVVDLCESLGVPGHLSAIDSLGRQPYPDAFFDGVLANSVFTHLPKPASHQGLEDVYGDAVCTPGFIARHWGPSFDLKTYIDHASQTPQSAVAVQRRP